MVEASSPGVKWARPGEQRSSALRLVYQRGVARADQRPQARVTVTGTPKQALSGSTARTAGAVPLATTRPPLMSSACVVLAGSSST